MKSKDKSFRLNSLIWALIVSSILLLISNDFKPDKVQAVTDHLVINEVYYDTIGTDSNEEWIEIYNPTDTDLNISDWEIKEPSKPGFRFPRGTEIGSKDYIVIARNTLGFESLYPTLTADFEWSGMSLSNSGDVQILQDSIGANIDVITYENGSFAGVVAHPGVPTGHSIERQPKGEDTNNCANDFIDQNIPTPGIGIPSATILLPASNIRETSLELSWTKVLDGDFERYELYQALSEADLGKNSPIFEETNQDVVSFKVQGLIPGKKYYFMVRIVDENEGYSNSNIIFATTKIEYSKAIILNEILPKPKKGTDFEFIELYNASDLVVDVSGWKLDDLLSGGSKPYIIPEGTIINPRSYLVFYKTTTKIALNDSGDNVYLLAPNDEIVSATSYKNAGYDISWNWTGKEWAWSQRMTAAAKNIIIKPIDKNTPLKTTIQRAKKLPKNTLVQVKGIVSVFPGPFGKKIIYIQNQKAGIQIYFYKGNFPKLVLGHFIKIIGKTSSVSGEKRIRISKRSDIVILGKRKIIPLNLATANVRKYIGMLVRTDGAVVKTAGSTFYLDDGSGKIRVYFKKTTGIKIKKSKGDYFKITGIVSLTKAGPRILPRFTGDVIKLFSISKKSSGDRGSVLGETFAQESARLASDYRQELKPVKSNLKFAPRKTIVKAARGMVGVGTVLLFALLLFSWWFSRSQQSDF